jgi:tRNA nucleotidyltransferase (CCA-adding enzyme)
MQLPETVQALLSRLRNAGFSAYAVGGCVRDTMLGKKPKDWDLCTSALPEQMKELF